MAPMDMEEKRQGPGTSVPGPPRAIQAPPTFLAQAECLGIAFDSGDLEKLGRYLALLLDANTRFNLTAITEPNEAWTRHILDSLTLIAPLASLEARTVIDIGSGAGLPGLPLAIVMSDVRFTLVEATGKKARFLEQTIAQLELTNATVICERAEVIGQDHKVHREQYDVVIARAVGKLPVLLELTVPLAKVGGHVLAMKGEKAAQEISEAKQALYLLHAQVSESITTPTGTIVAIEKLRKAPRVYPRKPGEPKRAPLH
jgi:16S rRNA (guanine527-N7)-methyltransferase